MDTLTHTMFGAVCGIIISKKVKTISTWKAAAVGASAGLFPDLDFVMNFISSEFYLRNHRAVTHSIILAPLYAMLISLFWCSLWKYTAPDGNPLAQKGGWKLTQIFNRGRFYENRMFWGLSAISLSAILTHIFMDFITSFGTMFMWPFTYQRYEFSSIFIIDLNLSSFAALAIIISAFVSDKNKVRVASALYVGAMLYILLAYSQKFNAQNYFKEQLQQQGIEVSTIKALPAPGSIFNWTVVAFDEKNETYYKTSFNLRKKEFKKIENPDGIFDRINNEFVPKDLKKVQEVKAFGDESIEKKAKRLFAHENAYLARWFFMYPAVHNYYVQGDVTCIEFKDLRYDSQVRGRLPFVFTICESANAEVSVRRKS